MAQLSSPGVSVTVTDESFYTSAAPGTVPVIFVASAENKQNGAGTGIAPGTLKANAGKVYLLTSQRDLADTFGIPKFITDANNNPIHAGEQNEYGLQAAYSFLGVSSLAYVVRADVDLDQLSKRDVAPVGLPIDNSFWFNTKDTKFGISQWDSSRADVAGGQTYTNKVPLVITDLNDVTEDYAPKLSAGAVGTYALVSVGTTHTLWFKKALTNTAAGTWVKVGSDEWAASWPVVQGSKIVADLTSPAVYTIVINTVSCTGSTLDELVTDINTKLSTVKAANITSKLALYATTASTTVIVSGSSVAPAITTIDATPADSGLGITAGTYRAPALNIGPHTNPPEYKMTNGVDYGRPSGSIWIKTTTPNLGASWSISRYNAAITSWENNLSAPLYANNRAALAALDATAGGLNLAGNTLYVKYNDSESSPILADFKIFRRVNVGPMTLRSAQITTSMLAVASYSLTISESANGSADWVTHDATTFSITGTPTAQEIADTVAAAINASLGASSVIASVSETNQLILQHIQGGDIRIEDGSNTPIAKMFGAIDPNTGLTSTANLYGDVDGVSTNYLGTYWTALTDDKTGGFATPSTIPTTDITINGTLWYNSITDDVDIMVHNGTTWVGYRNYNLGEGTGITDVAGPIVSPTKPTTQSDGSRLRNGDIWINTSDLENYPAIYRFQTFPKKWILVDKTDQTTDQGILFRDARWNTDGKAADASTIADLLTSDFLDFDAPDPALYPKGMLLWNLRRSGFNVKKFVHDYVDVTSRNPRQDNEYMGSTSTLGQPDYVPGYYPHRWISVAANQIDGSGSFGRKSQRAVVVQALQAMVNSNQDIRDEEARIYNLIATPGYPELVGEMKTLNYDRGITSFVVADTPARLTPDATSLSNWGNNLQGAAEDNDAGLVSSDEYMAFFYPWGYSSDNLGNNIAVPPSHMMLRTIALSDNVSYPWFAPAGTRRGGITNADSVGYITSEGEFKTVALNTGQRDTLQQQCKVNPLTFINGAGIVNFGQLTRAKNASSLDRINVARLVVYLRRQFAILAKPYLFEPNDEQTRKQIKQAAEGLLMDIVGKRGLYDYAVVCDASNNTPARIDRNELYMDIAIEPMKAIEFIYIPLVLKNTGEINGLG